jgi:ATP-dependent helicase HrpA
MRDELDALVPRRFLAHTPFDRLPQLPRYLKALLIRAERASLNPVKDAEKVKRIAPYVQAYRSLVSKTGLSPDARLKLQEFRWLIEEYKVSCFAQELGTTEPVSPARLSHRWNALLRLVNPESPREK